MALELKQNLKLSQSLVMTPQLQQAIKLLQLNRLELIDMIQQELVDNPILEEGLEESSESPSALEQSEAEAPEQSLQETQNQNLLDGSPDEMNWEAYLKEFSSGQTATLAPMKETAEETPSLENQLSVTTTLEEHLIWQLKLKPMSDPEIDLGKNIIGNLNEDGYFTADLAELAKNSGVDLEDAEEFLKMIQNFDPLGVASRTLQECLLVQAKVLYPNDPLVSTILTHHMKDLEKRNYSGLSKTLNKSVEEIRLALQMIVELEPKPARAFPSQDTHYITPDIYIVKSGDDFMISLNEDGLPKLKISGYYQKVLQSASENQGQNKATREYVQDKMRSALWLIRSIHNRQRTIVKVTEAILSRQKDFFEKGSQFLKPMILRDIAQDIGMHESTISRVTTNKYMHTPMGIFELKYFFSHSLPSSDHQDGVATEVVKEKLKKIVSQENTSKPLSDQQLVDLLAKDNIHIARRTVAKYREALGILPSSKRKNF